MNCELEPALGSQYSRKKSAVDKNYYRIGHARLGFSWKKIELRISYYQNFGRSYWAIK